MEETNLDTASKESNDVEYPERNVWFYLGVFAICSCCFMATIDTVILATSLPAVTQALNATSIEAYWCGTGYLFTQTIGQPIYGAFQGMVGHKQVMLLALSIFTFASILCATAQNISWLVATRVVQGFGGGGINAMVNVLIADITPLKDRGIFIGMVNLAGAFGLVSGVVLGAAFSEKSTWRWIFYINIPICVVAGSFIQFCLRLPRPKSKTAISARDFLKLDWIGLSIFTASLVGILYGITGGGVLYAWDSARIICALIFGCAGIVAFLVYEIYTTPELPVIPFRVFSQRTAAYGFFSAWSHGLVLWTMAYYLILYFLIGRGHSLLHSATEILPGIATIPALAAVFGIVMSITKQFKWFNVAAWISLSVGVGVLSTTTATTNLWQNYGAQLILAVGGGIIFPGRLLAAQAGQKQEDVAMASALASFFTSLGEAFGVGLGGTVIQNRWSRLMERQVELGNIPPEYKIPGQLAEQAASKLAQMPPEIQKLYRTIMTQSVRTLWIVLAILSAVSFFASLLQKNLRLDSEEGKESTGPEGTESQSSKEET